MLVEAVSFCRRSVELWEMYNTTWVGAEPVILRAIGMSVKDGVQNAGKFNWNRLATRMSSGADDRT